MVLTEAYQPPLFPTEKACSACGRLLPTGDFYRKRDTQDGLTSACKACVKERVRAYQERHREERRAYGAAHYAANREGLRARQRAYYQTHLGESRARGRTSSTVRSERRKAERLEREAAAGPPVIPREKTCQGCGQTLPLESFYPRRGSKDGRTGKCRECIQAGSRAYHGTHRAARNASSTAYYEANRERLQEAAREYYHAHEAAYKAARTAWNAANAERARASNRAYYHANRERLAAYKRAYGAANREAIRERRRAWQRAHAEYMRAANRRSYHRHKHDGSHQARRMRRRARAYAAEGCFSARDVRLLYAAQEGLCAYCGVAVGTVFDIDHKTPLSRDGSNWPDNLAIACPRCNRSKGDATEQEYREWRAKHT